MVEVPAGTSSQTCPAVSGDLVVPSGREERSDVQAMSGHRCVCALTSYGVVGVVREQLCNIRINLLPASRSRVPCIDGDRDVKTFEWLRRPSNGCDTISQDLLSTVEHALYL